MPHFGTFQVAQGAALHFYAADATQSQLVGRYAEAADKVIYRQNFAAFNGNAFRSQPAEKILPESSRRDARPIFVPTRANLNARRVHFNATRRRKRISLHELVISPMYFSPLMGRRLLKTIRLFHAAISFSGDFWACHARAADMPPARHFRRHAMMTSPPRRRAACISYESARRKK